MPETINYIESENLILVESFGKVTIDDINGTNQSAIALCRKKKCHHVLVDLRKQTEFPVAMDTYIFAETLPNDMSFAIIKSEFTSSEMRFLETVGNLAGKSLKTFFDIEEGKKWLLAQSH